MSPHDNFKEYNRAAGKEALKTIGFFFIMLPLAVAGIASLFFFT